MVFGVSWRVVGGCWIIGTLSGVGRGEVYLASSTSFLGPYLGYLAQDRPLRPLRAFLTAFFPQRRFGPYHAAMKEVRPEAYSQPEGC